MAMYPSSQLYTGQQAMRQSGQQAMRQSGQQVRQGGQNYTGTGYGAQTQVRQQAPGAALVRGQRLGGYAPPQPQRQMQQVADVRFNRAQPPPAARPMPQFAPGSVGGQGVPGRMRPDGSMGGAVRGAQPQRTTAAAPAMPGSQQGVLNGAQPAYNGMMMGAAPTGAALFGGGGPQVLGPATPSSAYSPGPAADQSLMGPKTRTVFDDAADWGMDRYREWDAQQQANRQTEGDQATYTGSTGSSGEQDAAARSQQEQSTSSNQQAGYGFLPALADLFMSGELTAGGNPVVNALVGSVGDLLSGMSNRMTEEDMLNIEKYFGESTRAYRDIIKNAGDIMNPRKRDQWESAARDDLNATVNADKLANLRMAQGAAGRGGFASSNAQTGIYGNAAQALATGERGLAQDRFGRDLSATQLGISGMGAGAGALQDLLGEGFTSNKELLSYLLTGAEKGADIGSLLADIVGGKFFDV